MKWTIDAKASYGDPITETSATTFRCGEFFSKKYGYGLHIQVYTTGTNKGWELSCNSVSLDHVKLKNKDLEKAKIEALNIVNNELKKYVVYKKLIEKEIKKK